MDVDISASLPTDLLVDIFRCLDATDLIHCTGVCKPWRRAIICNASSFRPRHDRFNPNLLLGFFFHYWHNGILLVDMLLQPVPGPLVEPYLKGIACCHDNTGCCERTPSLTLIPAATADGMDLSLYNQLLSSRDGFILLGDNNLDGLCLCNPMAGYFTFFPAATTFQGGMYLLVTGYYDLNTSDDLGLRIIVMDTEDMMDSCQTIRYQIFSPTSGANEAAGSWGPEKRSTEFEKHLENYVLFLDSVIVCGCAIHWLGETILEAPKHTCIFSLDVNTGQTWTTEMPEQCRVSNLDVPLVLATSSDGHCLSVVSRRRHDSNMHVWVLTDGNEWMLHRTIQVPNLTLVNQAFCPRSGCILVCTMNEQHLNQELLIDVERGSSRLIRHINLNDLTIWESPHSYEMDWSTYLSKMKLI